MSSVIILEGLNGLGKTTYAKQLSEKLGLPIYRAFRDNMSEHWGDRSERERMLKDSWGVPLNTHVDDLYAADIVARLRAGVIFDRSMPSAIAYGLLQDNEVIRRHADDLLKFWEAQLVSSGLRLCYVWLTGPYSLAKGRCEGRRWSLDSKKFNKLNVHFDKIFSRTRLPKRQINVETTESADGVRAICKSLEA